MPIHPIEYRYGSEAMRQIFTRDNWLSKMLEVEAALAWAHAEVGDIPKKAAAHISKRASTRYVKLEKVNQYEKETGHEVMAVVKAFAEVCEPYSGMIHLGATSNDITDSVLALQLKEALAIVEKDLMELALTLTRKAEKYRDTVSLGRTHGTAALPMPFGFKFAVWASDVKRHLERIQQCRNRVCVGKMSGAIGTMAGFGSKAMQIQAIAMKRLGIKPAEISTQIVQRDNLAEFVTLLSLISCTLDKIANEIRNLQRTEIREAEEPFREKKQVGSSTMPHKRNPVNCEKVCGLARVIRGFAPTALENIVLEHERDLTNSSSERAMVPEVCILLDEQLKTMKKVMKDLRVYPENMKKNLAQTKGLIMSEAVMLAMTKKGADRQWAHEVIRRCSMKVWTTKSSFEEVLKSDPYVPKYLCDTEIEAALNPQNYLGTAKKQIDNMVKNVQAYVKALKSK